MVNKKRAVLVLISGIAVLALGWRLLASGKLATAAPVPAPVIKVALAPVTRTNIAQAFAGVGELEAIRQVQVAAEVSGRVSTIAFVSGQAVKAGQVLVRLNDAPEQAEQLRLQAQLRNAESVHARLQKLVAANAATQEQLEQALAARDTASAELQRIQAMLAQKIIRAPFAGVLGIRKVHEGQYLKAADAIVSLIDSSALYVNFSLDEQTSAQLHPGQKVEVQVDAYPGRRFSASINALDPLIARSRMVQVQARVRNPDGVLKAGMYASIRVERQHDGGALTVPETAVTYTAYGETVFVAHADPQQQLTVKRVAVKVGERQNGRVEITAGLREHDRVVTSGQLKLSDGVAVQAVSQDTVAIPLKAPAAAAPDTPAV
ncbi:efflux RND transporter periplasmic adaptor subunit [Herbaspirillum autotrophicum]|uniref:efflux RND transporter periplasmic adaptor subunit n=1 Tax=Herbaspirillum autotrophicum TaxID=180195 RepID=UPI00067D43C3|nr:efflux RND transporter periplasmic adaptor subunit [Herbaspirillum autotrophicum]